MLFPVITTAYFYAYEARAHGIVLGYCGVALVCWQASAAKSERRLIWLLGLGGALTSALLTHPYAVLLFIPLISGELARAVRVRRVDWPIWVTFAASSTGVLVSIPLLHALRRVTANTDVFPANLSMLAQSYKSTLLPATGVLSLSLVLLCIAQITPQKGPTRPASDLKRHEFVALLAFTVVPFLAFLLAKMTGGPMLARYSISFVAGLAGLLGIAAAKRPALGIGLVLAISAQISLHLVGFGRGDWLQEPSSLILVSTQTQEFRERYRWIDSSTTDKNMPVVLLDNLDFLPTIFYAPANLVPRLVFVFQPGNNTAVLYKTLQDFRHLSGDFCATPSFLTQHASFLAYGSSRSIDLIADFIRRGAEVSVKKQSADHFLVSVNFRNKQ
jgi:hypothetical protein